MIITIHTGRHTLSETSVQSASTPIDTRCTILALTSADDVTGSSVSARSRRSGSSAPILKRGDRHRICHEKGTDSESTPGEKAKAAKAGRHRATSSPTLHPLLSFYARCMCTRQPPSSASAPAKPCVSGRPRRHSCCRR